MITKLLTSIGALCFSESDIAKAVVAIYAITGSQGLANYSSLL